MINNIVNVTLNNTPVNFTDTGKSLSVTVPFDCNEGFFSFNFNLKDVTNNDYLLLPACAYNANKANIKKVNYPPMFSSEDAKIDMERTFSSNIHRLNKDGSGCISVHSGNLATPCVAIFSKAMQKGYFLFFEQGIGENDFGVAYKTGEIILSYPTNRTNATPYGKQEDKGLPFKKGETIELNYKWFEIDCKTLEDFYQFYFENRKCMKLDDSYSNFLTLEEAWTIQENKYNDMNFEENIGFYKVGCGSALSFWGKYFDWQLGWVGGGIATYPLIKKGNDLSYKRSIKTLDFLFSTQQESGFPIGIVNQKGNYYGDAFDDYDRTDWLMVRKAGDALYFLYKHFDAIKQKGYTVPQNYIDGAKKLADAFVKNWYKYHQMGQFVSQYTGELIVGGSTAGAIVPAALAVSYKYFGESKYLDVAKQLAKQYYNEHLKEGYTGGGPGEILQSPDSESAFALLESFVVLYEITKDDEFLAMAKECAAYCSSWVVSYNYKFPTGCEFQKLGIKSVGSVFANVQNKHSAPGICTLSGDSLYKLYKFTNDKKYLELIKDIALNIFQYISTTKRPIHDREDKELPQGFINERVNTCDWEGKNNVGTVFYGSTWAEVSSMLTIVELSELFEK